MLYAFLKKISEVKSQTNTEFLYNCVIGIDKQLERLNANMWTIKNKLYDNVDSKSLEFNKKPFASYSNILAYNNNKLDKMILAHSYGQRFNEVFE